MATGEKQLGFPNAVGGRVRAFTSGLRLRGLTANPNFILQISVVLTLGFLVLYPLWYLVQTIFVSPRGLIGTFSNVLLSPSFQLALTNSLVLAISATIICVVFGVPAAWFVTSTDMPSRSIYRGLYLVCYMTPSFIFATSYLILLGRAGFLNRFLISTFGLAEAPFTIFSMGGLVLVISLFCFPFVFLATSAALEGMDPTLTEAARVCGANPFKALWNVTLPMLMPAISAGAILVFVQSITLFGAAIYLGLPGGIPVLTTEIYKTMSVYPSRYEVAAVLSIVLMVLSLIPLLWQFSRRGDSLRFVTITSRAGNPQIFRLGRAKPFAWVFCFFIAFIGVLLPYSLILASALSQNWTEPLSPTNWTLDNFAWVLSDRVTMRGIGNSLFIGGVSAILIVILASVVSYTIVRTRGPLRASTEVLSLLPLAIPGTTLAVGLVLAYIRPPLQLYGTIWLFFVAYVIHFSPLAVRVLQGVMVQIDPTLEESARMSGAGGITTFRTIVAPLLKPAMAAAFILVFIPAMKEFTIGILIYRVPWVTMSISLYEIYTAGQYERVTALAIIFMVIVLVIYAVAQRVLRRSGVGAIRS